MGTGANMSETENNLVSSIMNLGEERMGELVGQLLANPRFAGAVERAVTSGLRAKKGVDSTLSSVFSAANVPTVEDVVEVKTKLTELEDALGDIEDRLGRLLDRLEADAD